MSTLFVCTRCKNAERYTEHTPICCQLCGASMTAMGVEPKFEMNEAPTENERQTITPGKVST